MSETCGPPSPVPFAYCGPDSSWPRTSQLTLLSDSDESSMTLPLRGSMRNGRIYERPMSERATDATACSGPLGLLPTPSAINPNDSEDLDNWLDRRERERSRLRNGNGFGMPLGIAVRLLPTPRVEVNATSPKAVGPGSRSAPSLTDIFVERDDLPDDPPESWSHRLLPTPQVSGGGQARNRTAKRMNPDSQHHDGTTLADVAYEQSWGDYAPAIARHAEVVGRPAPPPTVDGKLSPVFVEWMQMLPEGWVTDSALGISRTGQLRALGNAIVWPQAVAAWGSLLGITEARTDGRTDGLCPLLAPRTRTEREPTAAAARTCGV